ncbi:MAG: 2Fe-2S iron-sulfur cluster binding domain-containing protein [Myxococcales bacterium]|nr:2Fe-2S iron-sulfur cluster binding domain-containing protein [Myxococcales bacterium]
MSKISYRGSSVELEAEESVLDALLRAGLEVASSCRAGACQACMLRAESGDPGAAAQAGLRPAQREAGFFLACMARPEEDLVIADAALPSHVTRIQEVRDWGGGIYRVRLDVPEGFSYRGGQYVQLARSAAQVRAYSLASLPGDPWLELHVRHHPRGKVSRWLTTAAAGDEVSLRGPSGECYYQVASSSQPLVLVGMGTGMAPIYAVLRDAIAAGHDGPITLVQGARSAAALYLERELSELCDGRPGIEFLRCVLEGDPDDPRVGDAVQRTLEACTDFKGRRVYLCGGVEQVNALKRQAFLRGARLQDISADPFVLAAAG